MDLNEIKELIDNEEQDLAFENLIELSKDKTYKYIYWKRYILFIYDNHAYFDISIDVELLSLGIFTCRNIREKFVAKEQSFFYLYEYNFSIEYIKLKPYEEKYNDIHLEELLDKAIATNPENPENYQIRGSFFNSSSKFDKADSDYKQAASLSTEINVLLYLDKAMNNEMNKSYNEAIEDFQYILKNTHNDILEKICYESLIRIYEILNNKEQVKYFANLLDKLE
jgi:tetratricopeptide (TPR) repeat protein